MVYHFSKNHIHGLEPHPLTSSLKEIKRHLEEELDYNFNSVLMNIYETGQHYADWHTDDDPWCSDDTTIASISFGHPRKFSVRDKITKAHVYRICFQDGVHCV